MANKFEVATIFRAVDRMSAPISRIQNRIGIMTRSADRGIRRVQRTTEGWARGLKKAGRAALVGGALVTGALASSSAAGIEFEQTIVNAAAKYPGEIQKGTEAFGQLEAAAQRTGAATEFSATQSAQALDFLAMAGFNAEQSIGALPGVVDLATVATVDMGTAADIATDSLGALGLMTKDSVQLTKNLARVNDVLAKTTTSANVSLEDMFESIKDGAPVGVAAGQSFETIATFIAKMGDAGIKGTRGGTALKNIFLALSAPGSEAAQVMRRLGVQTVDAQGNVRDAVAVFKDFSDVTKTLPSAQKLAVFDQIFGKIPIAAALNITAAADSMGDFRDSLIGAEGTAAKMAGTMRDTTRGSINALKSSIEGVSIELFALNRGPMKEAIDSATAWVRANGGIIAQNIGGFFKRVADNLDTLITVGKKVATIVAVLWTLNTVLSVIRGTLLTVNLILAANPLVLGAIALAAAVTGVYLAWEPLKTFFSNLFDGIGLAFDATIGTILNQIEAVKRVFSEFSLDFSSGADRTAPSAYATGLTGGGAAPQISNPLERQVSIAEERRTSHTTEVRVRAEQGTTATAAPGASKQGVHVMQTGGF